MANKKIQTTELDFDQIKANIKTFLQGQSEFSDYDFEGAGLSILLDVLAYNTHYNALYTNLAVNEAFLDSASKRQSVVSKAKEIGYVPSSAKATTAIIDVTMINNQLTAPAFIEIPRYTPFATKVDGVDYTFYTTEIKIAYKSGNQYLFEDVQLKEGTQLQYKFVVVDTNVFTIPNAGVDLSTLRVVVQENAQSSSFKTYVRSDLVLGINSTSEVYFIKEGDNGLYDIEFGNGIVGKALSPGNVITIDYIVCNEDRPNGAKTFTYGSALPANTQAYCSTVATGFGGTAPENINSIKWNAPRQFASQNRCVTLDDYKTIIYSLYPDAQAINVWGGETNNPPSYGDVYISVKPQGSETLSDAEQSFVLKDIIGPRKVVTIHPKFVDPTYLYVKIDTAFYYDRTRTNESAASLSNLVRQAIIDYDQQQLNRFNTVLKYSALSRAIDSAEQSINNSITTLTLYREIVPQYNQVAQYIVDIGNPIYYSGVPEKSVYSTGINILNVAQTVYIEDVPTLKSTTGDLRLFYYDGENKVFLKNIGTVQYAIGLITINDLVVTGLPETIFNLTIKPQSNDVAALRNQIVAIKPELITVTPIIDTDATNYRFTSSRT